MTFRNSFRRFGTSSMGLWALVVAAGCKPSSDRRTLAESQPLDVTATSGLLEDLKVIQETTGDTNGHSGATESADSLTRNFAMLPGGVEAVAIFAIPESTSRPDFAKTLDTLVQGKSAEKASPLALSELCEVLGLEGESTSGVNPGATCGQRLSKKSLKKEVIREDFSFVTALIPPPLLAERDRSLAEFHLRFRQGLEREVPLADTRGLQFLVSQPLVGASRHWFVVWNLKIKKMLILQYREVEVTARR